MKLRLKTGFFCPACGSEAEYETGFWGFIFMRSRMERFLVRLNRHGGSLTSKWCGHAWVVKPGSRRQPRFMATAYPRKGGQNPWPSQATPRPAPPVALRVKRG